MATLTRKVEKLKSGRYKVRFRMPGRETSQTFDRHADARRFALLLDVLPPQAALDPTIIVDELVGLANQGVGAKLKRRAWPPDKSNGAGKAS